MSAQAATSDIRRTLLEWLLEADEIDGDEMEKLWEDRDADLEIKSQRGVDLLRRARLELGVRFAVRELREDPEKLCSLRELEGFVRDHGGSETHDSED